MSPFFAPRSQQRVLERGWGDRRVFLDAFVLPSFHGWKLERIVLAQGELQPGREAPPLLHALVHDCRVAPFLVATDWERVLLGFLSLTPPSGEGTAEPARSSVSFVLQSFLKGIEVFREPVRGFSSVVNHRYDRLFGTPTASS